MFYTPSSGGDFDQICHLHPLSVSEKMNHFILTYFKVFQALIYNYINKYSALVSGYTNIINKVHGTRNTEINNMFSFFC